MKSIFCILFLFTVSSFAGELKLETNVGDELKVEAPKGKITLVESKTNQVVVRFKGEASFFGGISLKRYGSQVVVKTSSSSKESAKNVGIVIEAPAMKAHLTLGHSDLNVKKWSSGLTVVADSGNLSLDKTSSALTVSLQSGQLKIGQHDGSLKVDTYKASTQIQKLSGSLQLESFSGAVNVIQHKGDANVLLHKGSFDVTKSFGSYGVKSEKAKIALKGHKGDLRGRLSSGALFASLIGTQAVRINSKSAPISLKVASTGAKADIGTLEGYLTIPRQLARARVGQMTVSRGKLSGSDGGSVYVRTESGNIKLY